MTFPPITFSLFLLGPLTWPWHTLVWWIRFIVLEVIR